MSKTGIVVTVGQLYMSKDVLSSIAAQNLPPVASFRIARAIREINKELEQFGNERSRLIQQYGEEIEKDVWRVKPESQEEFNAAINEIADEEVTLNVKPLKPSDLNDVDIAPGQAMMILYLFEEE